MGKIKKQYFLSHVNFQSPPIQGGGIVAYHPLRSGRQTVTSDSRDMDRAEAIKFKLMPDGHIRGVQTQRSDLASAAEWMI